MNYGESEEFHWKCKDGRSLRLNEMDLSHIINSVRKIIRDEWRTGSFDILISEIRKRGKSKIADNLLEERKMHDALR